MFTRTHSSAGRFCASAQAFASAAPISAVHSSITQSGYEKRSPEGSVSTHSGPASAIRRSTALARPATCAPATSRARSTPSLTAARAGTASENSSS